MKTFQRPDYSLHFLQAKKTFSNLSLNDVVLLLSAIAPTQRKKVLIFQPSQQDWIRVPEHQVVANTPFRFQRNVKAPPADFTMGNAPGSMPREFSFLFYAIYYFLRHKTSTRNLPIDLFGSQQIGRVFSA